VFSNVSNKYGDKDVLGYRGGKIGVVAENADSKRNFLTCPKVRAPA
jgi:hypothetical protein